MTFNQLALIPPILKALETVGYTTPTPIQAKAIPIILEQTDLLGCAQTGTGKTAAFAIPILQLLSQKQKEGKGKRVIQALIVTPTRELAIQIAENFSDYGKYLSLKHTVIFGGVSQKPQTEALQQGVDILIATPGRLLDLIGQKFVDISKIEIFVLDEADRMLDMGFINDVKKLIKLIPERRQSLFFSATMPQEIAKLSETILHNHKMVEVTPVSSTAETVKQGVYFVDKEHKNALLLHLLENKEISSLLVFTRTKHGANKVVKVLDAKGIRAAAIHGNKSQTARQNALQDFKNRSIRVLVATDIAARGIDIDELEHVLNFEIPNISETYVHRIGRTGRAGANGTALSFCDKEEFLFLRDIQRLIKQEIPIIKEHPFLMLDAPENIDSKDIKKALSPAKKPTEKSNNANNGRKKWHK